MGPPSVPVGASPETRGRAEDVPVECCVRDVTCPLFCEEQEETLLVHDGASCFSFLDGLSLSFQKPRLSDLSVRSGLVTSGVLPTIVGTSEPLHVGQSAEWPHLDHRALDGPESVPHIKCE